MNTVINLLSVNWIQFLTTCFCRCKTYRKDTSFCLWWTQMPILNGQHFQIDRSSFSWRFQSNISNFSLFLSSFTLKLRLSKKYVHLKLVADLLALVCLSSLIHDTPQSSPLYSSESYEKATRNEVARISKARVFSFFNSM